jgi:DNA repair protein RecO (recombination protein O)
MALVETEGLVLKSYSLAEADKIVVFLTQKHGLIRGVAKGAKRLKSKFGGSLEPFTIVNLNYFQKEERELVSISQIEVKKSFFAEAANPEFLQKFAYLSDLLFEFAPPNEPNERLYRMACVSLETASVNPQSLESIALYFELWLLRLAGFLPNWNKCDLCQREFGKEETTSLQANFHLFCSTCRKAGNRMLVSPQERNIYATAQTISPTKFVEFASDKQEEVKNLSYVLKRIISHIIGKDIVGEKLLIANKAAEK